MRRSIGSGAVRSDRRAVSTVLGYVLSLTISAILVSGLLLAAGAFVEDERDRVARSELEVIGQRMAADLAGVDRLVDRSGSSTELERVLRLPDAAGGAPYSVEVSGSPPAYEIALRLADSGVTVRVEFRSRTAIDAGGSIPGGDVRISYDGGGIKVEAA
ncbi:DUF7266 family protein [Halegenticoccus soli]|uniref:DUF7266 family protein n=1 Tax=Halegenticoccus soli TaxID=1985678 RepID=UPI000C6E509A|nr:hypothetical protein [Halegenticoccus soli]